MTQRKTKLPTQPEDHNLIPPFRHNRVEQMVFVVAGLSPAQCRQAMPPRIVPVPAVTTSGYGLLSIVEHPEVFDESKPTQRFRYAEASLLIPGLMLGVVPVLVPAISYVDSPFAADLGHQYYGIERRIADIDLRSGPRGSINIRAPEQDQLLLRGRWSSGDELTAQEAATHLLRSMGTGGRILARALKAPLVRMARSELAQNYLHWTPYASVASRSNQDGGQDVSAVIAPLHIKRVHEAATLETSADGWAFDPAENSILAQWGQPRILASARLVADVVQQPPIWVG